MILGSYYEVYKTCPYPGCRCHRGKRHGPFPALTWSADGKRHMAMVRRADTVQIKQKAKAYKQFQLRLKQLRKVDVRIEKILGDIRSILTEAYR